MLDFSQSLDLTATIGQNLRLYPGMEPPERTLIRNHPEKGVQVSRLKMSVHSSTHADAPRHFLADGPTIDRIPVEKFCGEAVLIDLGYLAGAGAIEAGDFEARGDKIKEGDIVVLNTDLYKNPDPEIYRHLDPEAAQWLVDRKIKCLAGDIPSVDPISSAVRYSSASHPSHHKLLAAGIPIVESLVNLEALPWKRFLFICLPLKIESADGAPARVVALPLNE